MSRIQLPIVKSFRASLCEQPPKFFFAGSPKGVGKVCLKFPSQCRQASYPFWGPSKKNSLKDFTMGAVFVTKSHPNTHPNTAMHNAHITTLHIIKYTPGPPPRPATPPSVRRCPPQCCRAACRRGQVRYRQPLLSPLHLAVSPDWIMRVLYQPVMVGAAPCT